MFVQFHLEMLALILLSLSLASPLHAFGVTTALSRSNIRMAIFEGNPVGKAVWNVVWKLPFMRPGQPGQSPTTFGDAALVLKSNILQLYGGEPSVDGAPIAEGEIEGLLEGSLFLGLKTYYEKVCSMDGDSMSYFNYEHEINYHVSTF